MPGTASQGCSAVSTTADQPAQWSESELSKAAHYRSPRLPCVLSYTPEIFKTIVEWKVISTGRALLLPGAEAMCVRNTTLL